jgi:hypothetical protein
MKMYQVHPLTAAIFLSILSMGLVGMFVMLPIACIQWSWNAIVSPVASLPEINVWQACLLYLSVGTVLYLLGFVQIDLEAKDESESLE